MAEVFESSAPRWEGTVFALGSGPWPGLGAHKAALKREGAAMYVLLGDPALRLRLPRDDLRVSARRNGDAIEAEVSVDLHALGHVP